MDKVAQALGIAGWPGRAAGEAMVVHLPAEDGAGYLPVIRKGGAERWEEYHRAFGPQADVFWRWQENTADQLWNLALRLPSWPPQTLAQVFELAATSGKWLWDRTSQRRSAAFDLPGLLADIFRPVAWHLKGLPERLRLFIDAQLLISAQATSATTNALYGAAALDLPRRGVLHPEGGMGVVAAVLEQALLQNSGRILYRKEAIRIRRAGASRGENERAWVVETRRGEPFPAEVVVMNLPPANIARLVEGYTPGALAGRRQPPEDGWGAFSVYASLDGAAVPAGWPLHHQVILCKGEDFRAQPAEGNTIFLSLSPEWDVGRAPPGKRALTISTHTRLAVWWDLYQKDPAAYEACKYRTARRILQAAEIALPGLRAAAELVLPGTPVTFERFTRRERGWVGGYPQTSLLRTAGPRLGQGLWMVGDSIFPGQSTPGVALGGLRVANHILQEHP
jgi:phytoene dehydrogenase-like protein